jgi:hypothetical protein
MFVSTGAVLPCDVCLKHVSGGSPSFSSDLKYAQTSSILWNQNGGKCNNIAVTESINMVWRSYKQRELCRLQLNKIISK